MIHFKSRIGLHWLFTKIAALGLIPTITLFNAVPQPHIIKMPIPIIAVATHKHESIEDDVDHEFDSFWIDIGGEG